MPDTVHETGAGLTDEMTAVATDAEMHSLSGLEPVVGPSSTAGIVQASGEVVSTTQSTYADLNTFIVCVTCKLFDPLAEH